MECYFSRLYPSIESDIVQRLNNGAKADIYFRHGFARAFTMRQGESTVRHPNVLTTDYLPSHILVACLEESEYQGAKNR